MTDDQQQYRDQLMENYLIDLQLRFEVDDPRELLMFGTFWDKNDRDQMLVVAYLLGRADQLHKTNRVE